MITTYSIEAYKSESAEMLSVNCAAVCFTYQNDKNKQSVW